MASVKLVLRKKKNKGGTNPMAHRIKKDSRSSFIHPGKHLLEDDWGAKEQHHSNHKRLNNFPIKKPAEVELNHLTGTS